jgi:hypothetical protein
VLTLLSLPLMIYALTVFYFTFSVDAFVRMLAYYFVIAPVLAVCYRKVGMNLLCLGATRPALALFSAGLVTALVLVHFSALYQIPLGFDTGPVPRNQAVGCDVFLFHADCDRRDPPYRCGVHHRQCGMCFLCAGFAAM